MITKKEISDIYCSYSNELFSYLLKMTGQEELSEDLLQETFERFIDYALKHEIDQKTVRPFLYRSAHNLSVNHFVRQSKRKVLDIDDASNYIPSNDSAHDNLAARELEARIEIYINTLSPSDRSIFLMHKEFQKTYDEIALDTGFSSRTVRRRIRNILDDLVVTLKKEGFLE
jgi:RNA polymerase sigma-70 factor (ECF subfamily)